MSPTEECLIQCLAPGLHWCLGFSPSADVDLSVRPSWLKKTGWLPYCIQQLHNDSQPIRVYLHMKFYFHSSASPKNRSTGYIQVYSSTRMCKGWAHASCRFPGACRRLTLLRDGCTSCPISVGKAAWPLASRTPPISFLHFCVRFSDS